MKQTWIDELTPATEVYCVDPGPHQGVNVETFMKVYARHLEEMVTKNPDLYGYGPEEVPAVIERMKLAIRNDSYSKEGPALKAACKELGIKPTYTEIAKFVRDHV